jgi:hypothetical protein
MANDGGSSWLFQWRCGSTSRHLSCAYLQGRRRMARRLGDFFAGTIYDTPMGARVLINETWYYLSSSPSGVYNWKIPVPTGLVWRGHVRPSKARRSISSKLDASLAYTMCWRGVFANDTLDKQNGRFCGLIISSLSQDNCAFGRCLSK